MSGFTDLRTELMMSLAEEGERLVFAVGLGSGDWVATMWVSRSSRREVSAERL